MKTKNVLPMCRAHIEHRFSQAEAAMRRAQAMRSGETLVQFAARLRSDEYQETARRMALRMTRIAHRCARLAAGR